LNHDAKAAPAPQGSYSHANLSPVSLQVGGKFFDRQGHLGGSEEFEGRSLLSSATTTVNFTQVDCGLLAFWKPLQQLAFTLQDHSSQKGSHRRYRYAVGNDELPL
jgi:hypothetical protein